MRIARVYCVEVGKIVDIYGARALFFAQDEPRRRFQFLCSDNICRETNTTKVTGVNYDKLVEEGDCIVQKPHFRMNSESPHIAACEWVVQERALQQLDLISGNTQRRRAHRDFRRLKSSDLVAVFWPVPVAAAASVSRGPGGAVGPSANRDGEIPGSTRTRQLASNRTRVDLLETVTSAYELLEPDERREATLRIGRGPTLSYHRAFCRIEHYLGVFDPRIFYGGVRVQLHGPNFSVRFFDRVQPYQSGSNVARTVSL